MSTALEATGKHIVRHVLVVHGLLTQINERVQDAVAKYPGCMIVSAKSTVSACLNAQHLIDRVCVTTILVEVLVYQAPPTAQKSG